MKQQRVSELGLKLGKPDKYPHTQQIGEDASVMLTL
jgi:hypothetical protein